MADNSEKNFNDEELADIMSEIESLESELVEDEDLSDVVSVESSDKAEGVEKVTKLPTKQKGETSISFDVQGDMRFNLGFVIDGKTLSVYVDADSQGLVVEMEGGVKLNVPFSNSKAA